MLAWRAFHDSGLIVEDTADESPTGRIDRAALRRFELNLGAQTLIAVEFTHPDSRLLWRRRVHVPFGGASGVLPHFEVLLGSVNLETLQQPGDLTVHVHGEPDRDVCPDAFALVSVGSHGVRQLGPSDIEGMTLFPVELT